MAKKVHVLMFDDDASGEKGSPIGVFKKRPSYDIIMNYGQFDSPTEIKSFFRDGYLWWDSVHME